MDPRKQCRTCIDWRTPITESPCNECLKVGPDDPWDKWRSRRSKHDKVGDNLRHQARHEGRPYKRDKAKFKEAANA